MFIYHLYNDYRCAVAIAKYLDDARYLCHIADYKGGWMKAAVVELNEAKPGATRRVLAMDPSKEN